MHIVYMTFSAFSIKLQKAEQRILYFVLLRNCFGNCENFVNWAIELCERALFRRQDSFLTNLSNNYKEKHIQCKLNKPSMGQTLGFAAVSTNYHTLYHNIWCQPWITASNLLKPDTNKTPLKQRQLLGFSKSSSISVYLKNLNIQFRWNSTLLCKER